MAVRWKTKSSLAVCAAIGTSWMPEDPVPITPTRLPAKSTPDAGQCPV
ncbi:Uncharacterised protein [Mycobacteroides abscessus subsp. abscessus]|nr:Uncharacterised protein [Mycobacteroides abscessus subsp. abscessus]